MPAKGFVTTSRAGLLRKCTSVMCRHASPPSLDIVGRAVCSRLRQQRKAAVGAVVQGGDEQAPLSLRHAVLSPLHLCSTSQQPSGWRQYLCV